MLVNLAVDMLYGLIDPRIRLRLMARRRRDRDDAAARRATACCATGLARWLRAIRCRRPPSGHRPDRLGAVFAPVDGAIQAGRARSDGRAEVAVVAHPLGTDVYGRDLLSRIIHAARSTSARPRRDLGGAVDRHGDRRVSGYRGGWVDLIILRWSTW